MLAWNGGSCLKSQQLGGWTGECFQLEASLATEKDHCVKGN